MLCKLSPQPVSALYCQPTKDPLHELSLGVSNGVFVRMIKEPTKDYVSLAYFSGYYDRSAG